MSDDDRLDRDAIHKRRALLIASAIVGVSACGGRDEPPPGPCLSPPYDPAIHDAPLAVPSGEGPPGASAVPAPEAPSLSPKP
jgi:hypothetical protein